MLKKRLWITPYAFQYKFRRKSRYRSALWFLKPSPCHVAVDAAEQSALAVLHAERQLIPTAVAAVMQVAARLAVAVVERAAADAVAVVAKYA